MSVDQIGWAVSPTEERALRERGPAAPEEPGGTKGLGLLLTLAAVIVVLLVARGFGAEARGTPLPAELAGLWEPSDSAYLGRTLELTPAAVILGLGDGQRSTHPIRTVVERESVVTRVFDVRYATSSGLQSMEIHLHPDGTLRLRNPSDVVWRRR